MNPLNKTLVYTLSRQITFATKTQMRDNCPSRHSHFWMRTATSVTVGKDVRMYLYLRHKMYALRDVLQERLYL